MVIWSSTGAMRNSMKFPQKNKNRTMIQSSITTSGYLSEQNVNPNLRRYMLTYNIMLVLGI